MRILVWSGGVRDGRAMDAIRSPTDREAVLEDAELRLRVAWLAAISGGPGERQGLIEAVQECQRARLAARGRHRVIRAEANSAVMR